MRNLTIGLLLFIFSLLGAAYLTVSLYLKTEKLPVGGLPAVLSDSSPSADFSWDQAPSATLRASVIKFLGRVDWQSRTATMGALQPLPEILQQGETVYVGDKSHLVFEFSQIATISASQRTQIELVETWPGNLVFNQPSGQVQYQAGGRTALSVKSRHLLTQIEGGTMQIIYGPGNNQVTVLAVSAPVTYGYNNSSYTTVTGVLPKGYRLIFSDLTRRIYVQRIQKMGTFVT